MKETWILKQYDDNTEEVYLSNNGQKLNIKNNHRFFQLAQKALDYKDAFGYDITLVYLTFDKNKALFDYHFKSEEIFSMHGLMPTYEEDHIEEVKRNIIFPHLNEEGYTLDTYLSEYGFDDDLIHQMNRLYDCFTEKYEAEYQEKLQSGQLEAVMMDIS